MVGGGEGADGRSSCFSGLFAGRLAMQVLLGFRAPGSRHDSLIWSPRRPSNPSPCAGETSMRWTRRFLIVLTLLSLGCARGDWTTRDLTLVDVTGTWEEHFRFLAAGGAQERTIRFVLQQNRPKVKGEVQRLDGTSMGSVEGLINGEVFNWNSTGQFISFRVGNQSYRGEATINCDEMSGRAEGYVCPCTLLLRRVRPEAIGEKKTQ